MEVEKVAVQVIVMCWEVVTAGLKILISFREGFTLYCLIHFYWRNLVPVETLLRNSGQGHPERRSCLQVPSFGDFFFKVGDFS